MTRRQLREETFRLLFAVQFYNGAEQEEQMADCLSCFMEGYTQEEQRGVSERVAKILPLIPEIDSAIDAATTAAWKLRRMGTEEANILRLAVYEMRYDEGVPEPVAINEAVELAKKYGQDGSAGFVNGILSKLAAKQTDA